MGFLTSKWFLIIVAVILFTVVLFLTGKKSLHNEITINASPEKVWEVLTDTDNYEEWNPVMKLLEGEIREGNQVTYQFTQDPKNISKIPSKVKKVVPYQLLNQGGGMPIILTFDHQYILEAIDQGTKLTIHEDYRGIGVNFWNPKPVETAYKKLNKAIKQRSESLN